jgi:hypothetical protein
MYSDLQRIVSKTVSGVKTICVASLAVRGIFGLEGILGGSEGTNGVASDHRLILLLPLYTSGFAIESP